MFSNANPSKRARYIDEELMDSDSTFSMPELHAQMTEFVHCAMENFTENNPRLCATMEWSNDDEMAMIRFQQEQKQFVEQSVSIYLDVIKPSILNRTMVDLAKKHAMFIYETAVQSSWQNVMMNNEQQSTINIFCPHSPATSSSSSTFSEKNWNSNSSSVYFESIETLVESQHVVTPVGSPLSLKRHVHLVNGTVVMPFVHEDAEVASVMDMGGYYDKLSVRNVHSSPICCLSPFSQLAGSVECAAVGFSMRYSYVLFL